MQRVNFKKITIQNFLSIGDDPVEINFKTGVNFITGINKDKCDRRNGCGKCLHPLTEIDVKTNDKTVLDKLQLFLNNK